jgi:NADPH:quinone reductase-like Zn-dependent oxidoreductase
MVMGHEFMGIVEETGKNITHLKAGDRVVVPFPIACGSCFFASMIFLPPVNTAIPIIMVLKEESLQKKAVLYLDIQISMEDIMEDRHSM